MERLFDPLRGPLPAARIGAGLVFVVAGAVKLVFENQGALRFAKIGLPAPLASVVGVVEIAAGCLLVAGAYVQPAAIALAVIMAVAILTTKAPLLFGAGPEPIGAAPKVGIWAFLNQARLDLLLFAIVSALAARKKDARA